MVTTPFNAVTYARRLKVAGMHADAADIQAEELENIINNNVATKDDLRTVETVLKNDIKIVELALKGDIRSLELELKGFMVKSMVTTLGVLVTLQGFMT